MRERPLKGAGNALIWRAIQLAGVKAIFMVRLLVLARLLLPEDFGLLAIAVTAIGFFLNATDIGMIPALVQGNNIDEEHYNVAWTVGVTRAFVVTLIVALFAMYIARIFDEERATSIIRVLALRPFIESLASVKVASLNRELQFRQLAIIKLVEALANTIISILLALSLGVWALVIGTLAGSVSYLIMSYLMAPHQPKLSFDQSAIQPLIKFGRWIFLTSLVIMAGNYILRVIISRQLGVEELGLYFLAFQLAFLPAEVDAEVVGSLAFPLFSRLQSELVRVTQAFRTVLIGITVVLFPICFLIIALAPSLVADLLGPRWDGTVTIIRILTLVSMIGLFLDVVVPIFKGLGKPQRVTVIEVVQSLLLIAFAWFLIGQYSLVGAALAWLPAMTLSMMIGIVYIRKMLPRPFTGLVPPLLAITLASGAGALAAIAVDNYLPGIPGLVISVMIALLITGGILWASDRQFGLGLLDDLALVFPQITRFIGHSAVKS